MAERPDIRKAIEEGLKEVTQVDFVGVPDVARLDSMDLDSLDWAELQIAIEEKLNIHLPDDGPINLQATVGELIEFLTSIAGGYDA